MSSQEYEYRGLMAASWDLLRGDTSGWSDRPFYRQLILEYGQPALDVGCGTGRLLLDYLGEGIDIDGVDNSPEMLALCREKAQSAGLAPALYDQNMESLDLPRRYRTILVPSSSLQLVVDPNLAARAVQRLYAHLVPGGAVVASIISLWKEGDPLETDWALSGEKPRQDGLTVRRWSRTRYDPAARLEHTRDRYELVRDGQVVASEDHQRSPATRGYTQTEIIALFRQAGFAGLRLFHEFSRQPAAEADTLYCILGTRP